MPRLIKTLQHYPISRDGDSGTSLTLNKITKILNLGCKNISNFVEMFWRILQHPCMRKYPSYHWFKCWHNQKNNANIFNIFLQILCNGGTCPIQYNLLQLLITLGAV